MLVVPVRRVVFSSDEVMVFPVWKQMGGDRKPGLQKKVLPSR